MAGLVGSSPARLAIKELSLSRATGSHFWKSPYNKLGSLSRDPRDLGKSFAFTSHSLSLVSFRWVSCRSSLSTLGCQLEQVMMSSTSTIFNPARFFLSQY